MMSISAGALVYFVVLSVLTLVAILIARHFYWSEGVLMSAIITLTILVLGVVIVFWLLIISLLIGLLI